jgi:GNAT superfamily N-acetyltransferase
MIIRPMARGDAETVHEIHGACLTRTLLGRYTHEQITAWMDGRAPEGYVRASEAGERFFVAEADGVVVGYASWEDDELLSLFVHPDCQSRGVGSALVEACLADAECNGGAITKVKSVLGAEAFYAKHGFASDCRGSTAKRGVEIPDTRMRREHPGGPVQLSASPGAKPFQP